MPVDLSVSAHEIVIVVLMFKIIDALPPSHRLHHFCLHSFGSLSEPHSPVYSVKRHKRSLWISCSCFVKVPRMHRLLPDAADDALAERDDDEEVED